MIGEHAQDAKDCIVVQLVKQPKAPAAALARRSLAPWGARSLAVAGVIHGACPQPQVVHRSLLEGREHWRNCHLTATTAPLVWSQLPKKKKSPPKNATGLVYLNTCIHFIAPLPAYGVRSAWASLFCPC